MHSGLVIWGEVALSSTAGVRARFLFGLTLFDCVATCRKAWAENKFLGQSSALQHLFWCVAPYSVCCRQPWVHCWVLTTSWGLRGLMLASRQSEVVPLALAEREKENKHKPKNAKTLTFHFNTKLLKQCWKILENSISDVCLAIFFFFFLVFCFGYHWNDPFGFFQSCNTVPAPPSPLPAFSSTYLSSVKELW